MSGDEPAAVVDRRPVVVTALPLPAGARGRLAELLGDVRVVDLRDAIGDGDPVVTPPRSPRAIARLEQACPNAPLVVAELADREHGVELPGPVRRLRGAGAVPTSPPTASPSSPSCWSGDARHRCEP